MRVEVFEFLTHRVLEQHGQLRPVVLERCFHIVSQAGTAVEDGRFHHGLKGLHRGPSPAVGARREGHLGRDWTRAGF